MAQLLSYAGVSLNLSTPELEARLAAVHPQDVFRGWDGWNFTTADTQSLPTPSLPRKPQFKIGVLHWPTGATRPAWFHQVVSSKRLNLIRTALGSGWGPSNLVMYDSRTESAAVTAAMYMLPALPLSQFGDDLKDSYLLTLTDRRFYFWGKRGTITEPTSWADLFAQLAAVLDITLTVETVHGSYRVPSAKWAGYRRPTATVLDAAATAVGQKVVANLDGTFKTVRWEGAGAAAAIQYESVAGRPVSGGVIDDADLFRAVPSSVNVVFPDESTGYVAAEPYVVNKTLTGLTIAVYGAATGSAAFAGEIFTDYPYTGSNSLLVNDYAIRAATDWYGWRLQDLNVVLSGINSYPPTGWEDFIEWTFQARDKPFASTFLCRDEWDVFPSGNWMPSAEPVPPESEECGPGCGWVVGVEDSWGLGAEVLSALGRCSGIDVSQEFHLRYASAVDKWVSQVWNVTGEAWEDDNFIYDTGEGPLRAWVDKSGDQPGFAASINDIALTRECCGYNYAIFTGGVRLASGFCTGDSPETPCSPNVFRVKVYCECPSIDGWQGPGWYGIDDGEGGTVVVELLESDRCDTDITITCGVYDTEAEANLACLPVSNGCCGGSTLPPTMYLEFYDGTGDLTVLNGTVIPVTYRGVVNPGFDPTPFWMSECVSIAGGTGTCRYAATCRDAASLVGTGVVGSGSPPTGVTAEPCPYDLFTDSPDTVWRFTALTTVSQCGTESLVGTWKYNNASGNNLFDLKAPGSSTNATGEIKLRLVKVPT